MRVSFISRRFRKMRIRMVARSSTATQQFKCRNCTKRQFCYGSRYCQNPFDPTSTITTPPAGGH